MIPPEQVRVRPKRAPVRLDRHWTDRVVMPGSVRRALDSAAEFVTRPVHTASAMFTHPGRVVRAYLQGNHAGYTGPIWMAFLGVAFYLAVNSRLEGELSAFFDPVVWFRDFWPYLAPLILLPVSALQTLLFRRRDITVGDAYAFGLYMLGQIAIFRALTVLLRHVPGVPAVHSSDTALFLSSALIAAEAAYVAWSVTGFYRDRRISVWLRGAFVYTVFAALGYGVLHGIVIWAFPRA
ncbi:MAG TPA: DUF3667 domain-containing protein [Longimicrobiales bacterium]